MKYYFAWVNEDEDFLPKAHCRMDENIFSLHIGEQEGAIPYAKITIANPGADSDLWSSKKSYAIISVADSLGKLIPLFKGRLTCVPTNITGELITVELIALTRLKERSCQDLLEKLDKGGACDLLFLSPEKREVVTSDDLLQADHKLIFWDRYKDKVDLSDIFWGANNFNLKGNYYRDSLKMKLVTSPHQRVIVNLDAKWVQRYQGSVRVDHILQANLPNGAVSTYSAASFANKWWKADNYFGSNGYKVEDSGLENLGSTQHLNIWVDNNDPILRKKKTTTAESDNQTESAKKIRIRKGEFKPSLKLGWQYVQPRHEQVELTLENKFQSGVSIPSKTKLLNLNLFKLTDQDNIAAWVYDIFYKRGERVEYEDKIYEAHRSHRSKRKFTDDTIEWKFIKSKDNYPLQQHRGTFFTTDRGKQAIGHAIEIAKSYLAASSRCVEISFCCGIEQALEFNCDSTVTIEDDRLPKGTATGKVKKLLFEVIGETGRMRAMITLACSVGEGYHAKAATKSNSEYVESGVLEDEVIATADTLQTKSGINYQNFDDQITTEGIVFPEYLGASDIVREVIISNDFEEQEHKLRAVQYPHSHNIAKDLGNFVTKVKLRLEDLRSFRVAKNKIKVNIPCAWSAPKQIDVGGR